MNAVKYVLRITLVGSSPRVWREIAVPSNIKLTSLAHVIVLAMGWEESHLSMFKNLEAYGEGLGVRGLRER
jgi:hypothetical protein